MSLTGQNGCLSREMFYICQLFTFYIIAVMSVRFVFQFTAQCHSSLRLTPALRSAKSSERAQEMTRPENKWHILLQCK